MERIPIKLVILGDEQVGKTSLFMTYTTGTFPHDYCPTVFEQNSKNETSINNTCITLTLNDVPGHPNYAAKARYLHYYNTDVFLLCFSLVSPSSLHNISDYWFTEISLHCPNTPILLVGTKLDLVHDAVTIERLKTEENSAPLTRVDGSGMCRDINAVKYMQCSSLTQTGVVEVVETAVCVALENKKQVSIDDGI